MNIAVWLHESSRRWPQRPALYRGTELIADYETLAQNVRRRAAVLQHVHGVAPGDRVAIFMYNACEYLEWMYAILWAGAVIVPINCKLHSAEAAWIAGNAEAKLILTDDGQQFAEGMLPSSCKEIVALCDALEMPVYPEDSSPVSRPSDALAWLFYTSGTTGRSKGAMLTHGNLAAMSLCYPIEIESVGHTDAMLYAAPISHGAGLYNFIFVRGGAAHVIPESRGFKAAEVLEIARSVCRVSLFAAPTMVKRLAKEARTSGYRGEGLRTIIYGGAPMYLADLRDAMDAIGPRFAQIYGQGESPMTITALRRDVIEATSNPEWDRIASSVGWPQSCVEVRVVDEDLRPLPPGQPGEVIVRGATVMKGYWQNDAATHSTLVDGWLRTGDVGCLDAAGMLTLTDRSKDVIISGGSNIYPREIEEALATHPGVEEVSVIGELDTEWGERVVAVVVLRKGFVLNETELNAWFMNCMASFKKPKRYVFLEELPKSGYGKILKTELRRLLAEAAASAVA